MRLGLGSLRHPELLCPVAWRPPPSNSLTNLGLDTSPKYTHLIDPNLLGHFLTVEGITFSMQGSSTTLSSFGLGKPTEDCWIKILLQI